MLANSRCCVGTESACPSRQKSCQHWIIIVWLDSPPMESTQMGPGELSSFQRRLKASGSLTGRRSSSDAWRTLVIPEIRCICVELGCRPQDGDPFRDCRISGCELPNVHVIAVASGTLLYDKVALGGPLPYSTSHNWTGELELFST